MRQTESQRAKGTYLIKIKRNDDDRYIYFALIMYQVHCKVLYSSHGYGNVIPISQMTKMWHYKGEAGSSKPYNQEIVEPGLKSRCSFMLKLLPCIVSQGHITHCVVQPTLVSHPPGLGR